MPIFEYSCCHCHHNFEHLLLSQREKVSCPKCASNVVEKQLSVFSSPGTQTEASAGTGCACTPQTCGCH